MHVKSARKANAYGAYQRLHAPLCNENMCQQTLFLAAVHQREQWLIYFAEQGTLLIP